MSALVIQTGRRKKGEKGGGNMFGSLPTLLYIDSLKSVPCPFDSELPSNKPNNALDFEIFFGCSQPLFATRGRLCPNGRKVKG